MLSVKLNRQQLTDVFKFVDVAVGDLVAFQVIIFELSVKHRRTNSVGVAVCNWVAFQVIIFDKTIVRINSDSSVSRVIPIAFE